VTTFHPEGYSLYGKQCLQSLREFFPGRVVAFYEEKPEIEGIDLRDFFQIKYWERWITQVQRHPGSDGQSPNGYDFRYDAQKFLRKVFVQDAVFDEDEYVFWFDADSFCKKPIAEKFLSGLFDGTALAYLGRKSTYTETGFLGFHTKHPDFQKFRTAYLDQVLGGRIFSQLKGWHDCIAFDIARQGISGRNLSPDGQNYDAVMEQSKLHPYMTHLKGNRKFDPTRKPKIAWAT
jgi:hypothetical protein